MHRIFLILFSGILIVALVAPAPQTRFSASKVVNVVSDVEGGRRETYAGSPTIVPLKRYDQYSCP